ncbi:hypothetical protein AAIH07_35025, partial [Pseudomonas aeruginosa]
RKSSKVNSTPSAPVANVPGAEGVLLTFDDFLSGIETFGERIQPLMQCRAHLPALTQEVA